MAEKKRSKSVNQIIFSRNFLVIVIAFLLLILLFLKHRSLTVFLIIAIIAGIINYFIHLMNFHIHIGHVSFLAVIFSYALGFQYGIIIIVIAHILPEVLAARADLEMVAGTFIYAIISFLASIFSEVNIITLGVGLTLLQGLLTFSFGRLIGEPISELITEDGVEFVMNFIYYISFANPLLSLIG